VNDAGVLEAVEGTTFHFDCQQILYAIGQSPLLELLSAVRGVKLRHGRVAVDRATGLTSNPKYFAGGDCVNGGREVVDAVADGKRAGVAIAAALEMVHA
jgi:glutamate synthase (NADPH/NADH) small chain